MSELQPGEVEVYRYGAWSITVMHTQTRLFGDLKPPLFFWQVLHDQAGCLKASFHRDLDTAIANARRQLARYTDLPDGESS